MKQPITPLRLSKRARGFLEEISLKTGASMTGVVEFLLDGAIRHPERWPQRSGRTVPPRGQAWRVLRARGSAFLGSAELHLAEAREAEHARMDAEAKQLGAAQAEAKQLGAAQAEAVPRPKRRPRKAKSVPK
jgi:hypothetical protein